MKKLFLNAVIVIAACSLLQSMPIAAQVSPTTGKAARVRITKGPEIERADPDFAIVMWTSNNPGGSPEHYGVVHYGTDPRKLGQRAKSPVRLNLAHFNTVFRVRMDGLKPATTYYYEVESTEANGHSDGVKSNFRHFTTPGLGVRAFAGDPISQLANVWASAQCVCSDRGRRSKKWSACPSK